MTLERDVRQDSYVIRIPREEMKRMFIRAWDNANKCERTTDEFVAKELYERILGLINSDMREPKDIIHKAIDNTTFAEEAYPNVKEELHKAVDMAEPKGEKGK